MTYNPRLAKVKPKIKVNGQTVQTGERPQTNGHTRTRTLPNVGIIAPAVRSIIRSVDAYAWDPEGKAVDGSEPGEGLGETVDDDGVCLEESLQRRRMDVLSLVLYVRVLVRESDLPVHAALHCKTYPYIDGYFVWRVFRVLTEPFRIYVRPSIDGIMKRSVRPGFII